MILNDLKPPQQTVLVNFFNDFWLRRTFQVWMATEWLEIEQNNQELL